MVLKEGFALEIVEELRNAAFRNHMPLEINGVIVEKKRAYGLIIKECKNWFQNPHVRSVIQQNVVLYIM